jgi:hypothetical protein
MSAPEIRREASMAKLKAIYDKAEEIPEGLAEYYIEKDGKFLANVEGIKTQADVDKLVEAAKKERELHKATKDKLAKFGDIDPDTLPATLSELEETKAQLEAITKDGKIDDTKLEPIVEARVKRVLGPVERQRDQLQRDLDLSKKSYAEKEAEVAALNGSIKRSRIENTLRDAAAAAKVVSYAIDDAVMNGLNIFDVAEDGRILTKDNATFAGSSVTPGIEAKEWLKDAIEKKPHWWPASVGGGSGGGKGGAGGRSDNPWLKENWNMTMQGRYVNQHGVEKATEAARAAGVTLGATKPAEK